jgi:hypothetical protein
MSEMDRINRVSTQRVRNFREFYRCLTVCRFAVRSGVIDVE